MTRFGSRVFTASLAMLVLLSGCSDDSTKKKVLSDGCTMNSDCAEGLVCTFSRCHEECKESRDCTGGARCVESEDGTSVCQLDDETTCDTDRDCPSPLICGADDECRNECASASQCLNDQVCSVEKVCADTDEVDDDNALVPTGSGGEDSGVGGKSSTGGRTSRGGTSSAAGTSSDAGTSNGGETTTDEGGSGGEETGTGGTSRGGRGGTGTGGGSSGRGGAAAGGTTSTSRGGASTGGAAQGGTGQGGTTTEIGGSAAGGTCEPEPCDITDDVCHIGRTSCTTGLCESSGAIVEPGTSCGDNLICDPTGACVTCEGGGDCEPDDPCGVGTYSCKQGFLTCEITEAAPDSDGTACGVSETGSCEAGFCVCPEGQSFYQGDCQSCPAFQTANTIYVDADPRVGVDDTCCGRVTTAGFGGPCRTIAQAYEHAEESWTINVTGDSLGNVSSSETYPIRLGKAISLRGADTGTYVCIPGKSGENVVEATTDGTESSLYYFTLGRNCQGIPSGAEAGVYVGPTGNLTFAALKVYDTVTGILVEGTAEGEAHIEGVSGDGLVVVGLLTPSASGGVSLDTIGGNGVVIRGGAIHPAEDANVSVSNVEGDGVVVDGGSLTNVELNISNVGGDGLRCRSDTVVGSSSTVANSYVAHLGGTPGASIKGAAGRAIFASTGCSIKVGRIRLGNQDTPCVTKDPVGIFAESDATVSAMTGSSISCMTEDGISLRSNPEAAVNSPSVTFKGTIRNAGCVGAYAEVGTLNITDSTIQDNHFGIVQRSALSSTDAADALITLVGPNTFKCNGKSEPGLCCTTEDCPNGFDIWNNSGLPLDATNNFWSSSPVSQCRCDENQEDCACSGSAVGETTPPDGLGVLRSPYAGSDTGTVDITGYGLATDLTCN